MDHLKIIIPMAGRGKRLAPLTLRRPKPLLRLADKRLVDHVIDVFQTLRTLYELKYIFIVGHLGEQIRSHMEKFHPNLSVSYYEQTQLIGQSPAVQLARDEIYGPTLLTYCDTLNITDFSFLNYQDLEGVAGVREVVDPRRFGVVVTGANRQVSRLIEKPKTSEHRLALSGLYYFTEGKDLITAIAAQMERSDRLNNEYYLADAINIMIESGARIRAEPVLQWLDAGTVDSMIETNGYLLQNRQSVSSTVSKDRSNIMIEPFYIHESARVSNSVIGPNVAIGNNCQISESRIENSIVDDNSNITTATLINSLIGQDCNIRNGVKQPVMAEHDQIKVY